ncbi:MAG: hypothetical protein RL308_1639 [Bacteroidota bacterium]|jgi:hypothetical protein
MIVVGLYIKDTVSLEYNRVELFNDEKISINSSIQNVNDISKTFTDFSQTFTIPASKQNNKIFKHWYENSLDSGFTTLIKADAYIELDTIPFRSGKIQLESCNVKDGRSQDYSITFIGALGSLKDKFAGLMLKDLNSTYYDFDYTATIVKDKVTTTSASDDVMFPLISSLNYWTYGSGVSNINNASTPIRFNELFPALRLQSVLDMIERDSKWNINFNGSFLTDAKFVNAYLYLKNSDLFNVKSPQTLITWDAVSLNAGFIVDLTNETFQYDMSTPYDLLTSTISITLTSSGIPYTVHTYKNGVEVVAQNSVSTGALQLFNTGADMYSGDLFTMRISSLVPITFDALLELTLKVSDGFGGFIDYITQVTKTSNQSVTNIKLPIKSYMPEIKIEDFFSGVLKMFNLTCYSTDGINYTLEPIESYYENGTIRDITKYIKTDNFNLNRVKTYKKINFEYEKSDSIVNVGFKSANNVEYGSLLYDTGNDGDEYNIKLPFEDLNFSNLKDKLQVGYALKSDLQKYTPKPIILYDYNPTGLTTLASTTYYFSTATSGSGTAYTSYKSFGQEYSNGTDTFSLNFNEQQSTLTNELIGNSLYQTYYQNYLTNIFDSKARLIKVSGILPTSLLTTLKLNDRLIIRDKRYLINNMVIDLTTGEVQFELLTDFRVL